MKNIKTGTWIIIGVSIIILITLLVMSAKIRNLRNSNQLQAVELSLKKDSVRIFKTKSGEYYGKFQSVEIENTNLKKTLSLLGLENKDLKAKDIKWRDIVEIQNLKLETLGKIKQQVRDSIIRDTVYLKNRNLQLIDWTNGYLWLKGTIENHQLEADYKYETAISSVTEKKKKSYIVTVSLSDPNAKIVTGSQIVVIPTKRWYSNPWIYRGLSFAAGFYLGSSR